MKYRYDKVCEYCKREFRAARSDTRFCSKTCRWNAALDRRRERKRQKTISALGGVCACGSTKSLFIRCDNRLSCGNCLRKESQAKFHKRWTPGKRGYVRRTQNLKWEQEYLDMLPDEERERFLSQFH